MKKFFLFAAAVVAAMTVNAKVYNFAGIAASDINVDSYGAITSYTMDEQEIPAVNYVSTVGDLMTVTFNSMADLKLQYKNGGADKDGHKDNILKCAADFLQTDGKNVVLVFNNLSMDDEIQLKVSAKGSTNAAFAATGATAAETNPETVAKAANLDEYVTLKFYAESSEVSIKETAGGYRIISATIISAGQGIENTNAAVKAVKRFENGQLIIEKAGRRYNALGAKL